MPKATVTKLRDFSETGFRIETGVPVPSLSKSFLKYPFHKMEVGDSFDAGEFKHSRAVTVRAAANNFGKRHGMKFVTRKTDDNRIRCWRVA